MWAWESVCTLLTTTHTCRLNTILTLVRVHPSSNDRNPQHVQPRTTHPIRMYERDLHRGPLRSRHSTAARDGCSRSSFQPRQQHPHESHQGDPESHHMPIVTGCKDVRATWYSGGWSSVKSGHEEDIANWILACCGDGVYECTSSRLSAARSFCCSAISSDRSSFSKSLAQETCSFLC